jgi:hypothetical protein
MLEYGVALGILAIGIMVGFSTGFAAGVTHGDRKVRRGKNVV